VSKESWGIMNDSLKVWFETGKVTDRKITFIRQDKTIFSGLLQATSLYDENKNVLGSNTVIFDLTQMTDENIKKYELFFIETNERLDEIKEKEYDQLDKNSKSEYDGLKEMFQMLLEIEIKILILCYNFLNFSDSRRIIQSTSITNFFTTCNRFQQSSHNFSAASLWKF